jgi:hypothetical protein
MKRLTILLAALLFAAAAGAYEVPKWRVVTDTLLIRKTYQDAYIYKGNHYLGMNGRLKRLAAGASDTLSVLGPFTLTHNSLNAIPVTYATSNGIGLTLRNTTAATISQQQDMPILHFSGRVWDTDLAGGSSVPADWRMFSYLASAASPVGTFTIDWSINGGAYSSKFSVNSVGNVTVAKNISASGTITSSIASIATTSTDGFISVNPTAAVTGTRVQYSPRERQTASVWSTTGAGSAETHSFSQEVIPMSGLTPGADSTRYAYKFNDSGDGTTYLEVAALYGDGTPAHKNGTANGTAAFSTNASADTVTIAGALTTDIYNFTWTSDPGTPGAVWTERLAGSLIVHTKAAVTGNPTWCWTRRKTFD